MSDGDEPKNEDNNTYTTAAPPEEEEKKKSTTSKTNDKNKNNNKKGKEDAVAKVSKAEIEKSLNRKKWIDRISMVLLASALAVYFIVLIISMVSSANSTVVEKEDTEKEMETPAVFVEFYPEDEKIKIKCTIELYINDSKKVVGSFVGTEYTPDEENSDSDWSVMVLTKFNYTGAIITPPDGHILKIERTITNYLDVECKPSDNITVYVNFFHVGQYDQYSDDEQDLVDATAYDALDSKLGYETDYNLEWYTISDELNFASKPQDLDGIDGAYDYYEMSLSGIYPLPAALGTNNSKTGFALYRKHTNYVYQDSTTFADVVAAIGGMYTSLASVLAWFLVKFIWGYEFKIYTWQIYKWTGYAPHAPKKDQEGKEGEEEGGDDGADV